MSVLSNFDIIAICDWLEIPLVGVFHKDKLPKQKKEDYFVVNLKSSTEGNGTHWVCSYIGNEKVRSFYYDVSFMPIEVKVYINQFKPYCKKRQVQSIDSTYCG
jgi:hypothetical protein